MTDYFSNVTVGDKVIEVLKWWDDDDRGYFVRINVIPVTIITTSSIIVGHGEDKRKYDRNTMFLANGYKTPKDVSYRIMPIDWANDLKNNFYTVDGDIYYNGGEVVDGLDRLDKLIEAL